MYFVFMQLIQIPLDEFGNKILVVSQSISAEIIENADGITLEEYV